tara:strand:- start:1569 stop:2462 length:894 start_codon:yes stop_codon:yes gene_type:complete
MSVISSIKLLVKFFLFPKYFLRIFFNNIKSFFGFIPGQTKTIFIAGYPKSGTTWMENFVSKIPGYNPKVLSGSRELLRKLDLPYDAFSKIRKYQYSSIKSHITPTKENLKILIENDINKIVVMYRDPRDIIVSNYNYVLKNNPLETHDLDFVDYTKINMHDGLMHCIKRMDNVDYEYTRYSKWVNGWLKISKNNVNIKCIIVKYEDLRQNPAEIFKNVLLFYGVTLTNLQLNNLIDSISLKPKKTLFNQTLPGMRSTMYKGIAGSWRDVLQQDHIELIKKLFGETLIELGYEEDLDW